MTPKNFLDYINKYIQLLGDNKKKILDLHKRFDGGLKVSAKNKLNIYILETNWSRPVFRSTKCQIN